MKRRKKAEKGTERVSESGGGRDQSLSTRVVEEMGGSGQGPPFIREHREYAQWVPLVAAAEALGAPPLRVTLCF